MLAWHADWRCGRSGECCSSAWPVPVERAADARLRALLRRRELNLGATVGGPGAPPTTLLRTVPDLDAEHVSLLGQDERGRCLLLEPGRGATPRASCAVQRQHGSPMLPTACRLFPRVSVIEPRGTSITLSHYCPSVARTLLSDDAPWTLVRDPPAFAADGPFEGLDARDALPPLLRPDALLDWSAHAAWEAHALETLSRAELAPEQALDLLALQAEHARAWRASDGAFADWLGAALALDPREPGARRRVHGLADGRAGDLALFARVLAAVPDVARALLRGVDDVPADASALEALDTRLVAPHWPALARPVRRYLAAHAFASWCAHQGRGLRTRVLALDVALAVLRVQALRICAHAGRVLDRTTFLAAARASDLLLLHLVSRETLHAALAACEGPRA